MPPADRACDGMSRRTLLAAGIAAGAMPLAAAPVPPAAGIKMMAVLARKDGLTHDAFTRHWIDVHGPLARSVAGVDGFVASEPIGPAAAGLFGEMDGIASVWYASTQASDAAVASPAGKRWLADGDTFISRPASHGFITREHIVVPGPRRDGAINRTLLLVRQPHLTHAQFLDHWLGRHAELARKVPGLTRSVFSEVIGPGHGPGPAEIDGIAESWWTGPGTETGGKIASPQAAAWSADGDAFIDNARSRLILVRDHVVIQPPAA